MLEQIDSLLIIAALPFDICNFVDGRGNSRLFQVIFVPSYRVFLLPRFKKVLPMSFVIWVFVVELVSFY